MCHATNDTCDFVSALLRLQRRRNLQRLFREVVTSEGYVEGQNHSGAHVDRYYQQRRTLVTINPGVHPALHHCALLDYLELSRRGVMAARCSYEFCCCPCGIT